MDVSDSGEFGRRLVALADVFDVKLAPTRQALYFEALRDLPFPAVARALNQAVRTCTFFPKPAELRAFVVGDAEDVAERAWLACKAAMRSAGGYASVVVADAALAEAILSLFGSWAAACAADLSPEMWASRRKEFGRVYRVLRDRSVAGPRYLVGACERENGGRGYSLQHVPVYALSEAGVRPLTAIEAAAARAALTETAPTVADFAATLPQLGLTAKGETA